MISRETLQTYVDEQCQGVALSKLLTVLINNFGIKHTLAIGRFVTSLVLDKQRAKK